MKVIDLQQAADYLESAVLIDTIRSGANYINIGINKDSVEFVIINRPDDENWLAELTR
jgi:hypothetical protein